MKHYLILPMWDDKEQSFCGEKGELTDNEIEVTCPECKRVADMIAEAYETSGMRDYNLSNNT